MRKVLNTGPLAMQTLKPFPFASALQMPVADAFPASSQLPHVRLIQCHLNEVRQLKPQAQRTTESSVRNTAYDQFEARVQILDFTEDSCQYVEHIADDILCFIIVVNMDGTIVIGEGEKDEVTAHLDHACP